MDDELRSIVDVLKELEEDSGVPKRVRPKVSEVSQLLSASFDNVSIDKARECLEEISECSDLDSYSRTQVWSITSMLEKL